MSPSKEVTETSPVILPVLAMRTDWIIGWKISNLVLNVHDERLMFFRTIWNGIIDGAENVAEEQAVCSQMPHHEAPATECWCGFNAFDERRHAEQYAFGRYAPGITLESAVLLRVGLKGKVLEGTYTPLGDAWGYRAQSQSVTDMFIERECFACDNEVTGFSLERCTGLDHMWPGQHFARQACVDHYDKMHVSLSFMRYAAHRSDVGMHWRDE